MPRPGDSHIAMQSTVAAVAAAVQPLAAVGLGFLLRRTRLFSAGDGETAAKFAAWVTLPSLIFQSFNGLSPADIPFPAVPASLLVTAASAAASWLLFRTRHPKERGLLAGAAGGGAALPLAAYPLVASAFGAPGLRVALLAGAANAAATWVLGYLLFATAGAAFPERYEHLDGGTYRGEWLGMLKQGYGVYAYPSGARYEGEWHNNAKQGRGVYRFPKGGVYEGEWRGGRMDGVGVRTFASGRVQAGLWREGKLVSEMEEWQCALAVEGASEAAAVARHVQVGGGTAADAAAQLAADPACWAYAAAAALALTGRQLTPTLHSATAPLAAAHAPLALLAWGMALVDLVPPQPRQAGDVSSVLALRLLPPLLAAAAAAALLPRLAGWSVAQVLAVVGPLLLCGVAPAPQQVLANAHRFRLNESLAAAITAATTGWALALLPLLAAAAGASAAAGSLLPFQLATCGAAAAAAGQAVVGGLQGQQVPKGKVRMQYNPAAAAAATAAGAGEAGNESPPAATAQAAAAEPAAAEPAAAAAPSPQGAEGAQGGESGGDGSGGRVAAGGEASAPSQPPPPQRRPSAFKDVGRDQQQPPPQALCSGRCSGRLRWRQPHGRRAPGMPAVLLGRRFTGPPQACPSIL